MRLPNGFGNVSRLPGNRRKPYRARITVSCKIDNDGIQKQKFKTIGYFETKEEGLIALSNYHQNPYSIESNITFAEIFDKWSDEKFETISKSNINGYRASYAVCESLYNMKFADIRKSHLQGVIDNCGKNYPTLRKLKVLFNQMFKYALENDICVKDYSEFVDIVKHKDKTKDDKHKPFTVDEIQLLWDNVNRNEYIEIILMLIYSGVRIGELLDLKKENVHIEEQYFDVVAAKTTAGIRKVPIADKTLPYFLKRMAGNSNYLLCTPDNRHFTYNNYKDSYWTPFMKELNLDHLPHDTRHTTISMLAKVNVNQTIIKRIVGHSGAMSLTEKVYTHFEIKQLIDAINLI